MKKGSRLGSAVTAIAMVVAVSLVAKYAGHHTGRQAARDAVRRQSISQNAPTGFMGAKWLMSMSDAKRVFPDAMEFAPGSLKFETTAFLRPAFVDLMFKKNCLLMIIITFKGDKTEGTYRQTHGLLSQEYGVFPEPASTSDQRLVSKKRIGRVMVEHLLYEELGMTIEQVMLYRVKGGS